MVCDGNWVTSPDGYLMCQGTLISEPYESLRVLFTEFLAPDPTIIGLVSGTALVFWITGIGAGRVVQLLRKT